MKRMLSKGMLFVFLLSLVFPATAAAEDELTYNLREDKSKQQFIISGNDDEFDVQMILPDGTTVNYDEFDADHYMYFSLENKRIWAVDQAKKGTYIFKITSEKAGNFSVQTKDSIERPEVNWENPFQEKVKLTGDEKLPLSWKATGDFASSYGNMKIMLQQRDGWHSFVVDTATIKDESYELQLPSTIPSGDYDLSILVDDEFISDDITNPEVIISYTNPTFEMETIQVVEQTIENGVLYVILDIPNYSYFDQLEAEIVKKGETEGLVSTIHVNDLIEIEEQEDSKHYLWSVAKLTEAGDYEGAMIGIKKEKEFTPLVELQPFHVVLADYEEGQIEWSLEEGLTNATNIDVTVNVDEGVFITILDEGEVLLHQEVVEKGEVFSAALQEGYRVIEVKLSDGEQNSQTFTRHFQVDHTPPRLEMIQPLTSHQQLDSSFASGYVEENSILIVNGKEITYDDTGYFYVDDFGKNLNIELTDESGNKVEYTWQPTVDETGTNLGWLWTILINIGIIGAATGFVFYLRRSKG
jgi:hypothetical protein